MSRFIERHTDGRIALVKLNRPEALNAVSGALAEELGATMRDLSDDEEIWVVVLQAAGDKAFCVGADLKERASFSLEDWYQNRKTMRAMFEALRDVPQPTIASVFGFALGGGFELALSCDLIVAAEGAQMGLPEARVGLLPAGGGTQLLTRQVGPRRSKHLIYTAARLEATEAQELGLVARVVAREELDASTMQLAREITKSSPVAVRAAKNAIDAAPGVPLGQGIEIENDCWRRVIESDDRAEGISAFNDKRDPQWGNR